MSDVFEVRVQNWLAPELGEEMDRATTAELSILVDDHSATRLEDLLAKTVRESARLSGYRLARWFAENWWRLRWEPGSNSVDWCLSHEMSSIGGGYVWPNLTFSSDGEYVNVIGIPSPRTRTEPVRYLTRFNVPVNATYFERGVDSFVEQVLERLRGVGVDARHLAELWDEVRRERADSELCRARKLEALLGTDPDQSSEELLEELSTYTDRFGIHAVDEVAAAAKLPRIIIELEALAQKQARPAHYP